MSNGMVARVSEKAQLAIQSCDRNFNHFSQWIVLSHAQAQRLPFEYLYLKIVVIYWQSEKGGIQPVFFDSLHKRIRLLGLGKDRAVE